MVKIRTKNPPLHLVKWRSLFTLKIGLGGVVGAKAKLERARGRTGGEGLEAVRSTKT